MKFQTRVIVTVLVALAFVGLVMIVSNGAMSGAR